MNLNKLRIGLNEPRETRIEGRDADGKIMYDAKPGGNNCSILDALHAAQMLLIKESDIKMVIVYVIEPTSDEAYNDAYVEKPAIVVLPNQTLFG